MDENPFAPPEAPTSVRTLRRRPNRTALVLTHVLGVAAFVSGLASWHLMSQVPFSHPAYGGPDPRIVLLLLGLLTTVCAVLSVVVASLAVWTRRFWRLLYVTPAATFAGLMVYQAIRTLF